MSSRRFIALGTASQVPTRERNHNGYFLRWDAEGFLFDPGEGTQRQMIFADVTASQITKIFITHFHGDHCLGLAGVLQRLSLDRVPQTVQIFYPASGEKYSKTWRILRSITTRQKSKKFRSRKKASFVAARITRSNLTSSNIPPNPGAIASRKTTR